MIFHSYEVEYGRFAARRFSNIGFIATLLEVRMHALALSVQYRGATARRILRLRHKFSMGLTVDSPPSLQCSFEVLQ